MVRRNLNSLVDQTGSGSDNESTEILSTPLTDIQQDQDLETDKTESGILNISEQLVIVEETNSAITEEDGKKFFQQLGKIKNCSSTDASIGFALLSLKGATNANAPEKMTTTFKNSQGISTTITKGDLIYACQNSLGHKFLRKIAEKYATQISKFATKNRLDGDLAIRLNNIAKLEDMHPLDTTERAWANSFNQGNKECDSEFPRVSKLLAMDYKMRFEKNKNNKSKKNKRSKGTNPPRAQNKPQGNNNQKEKKGQNKINSPKKNGPSIVINN